MKSIPENLAKFLDAVKDSIKLQALLDSAATVEAVIKVAKDAGYSITNDDIQSYLPKAPGLRPEEFEKMAGGNANAACPWYNTPGSCG